MQHAKDDATRAVLLEAAAAKAAAKVPADIAELLAKVSVSAAAIGPRLAVSGAACVADLPRLFEEKPEVVDSLSGRDRNKLLMLVGQLSATPAPAFSPAAP